MALLGHSYSGLQDEVQQGAASLLLDIVSISQIATVVFHWPMFAGACYFSGVHTPHIQNYEQPLLVLHDEFGSTYSNRLFNWFWLTVCIPLQETLADCQCSHMLVQTLQCGTFAKRSCIAAILGLLSMCERDAQQQISTVHKPQFQQRQQLSLYAISSVVKLLSTAGEREQAVILGVLQNVCCMFLVRGWQWLYIPVNIPHWHLIMHSHITWCQCK